MIFSLVTKLELLLALVGSEISMITPQHKAEELSPAYKANDDRVVSFFKSLILDIIISKKTD
jgi:hypothetical protein